MEKVNDLDVAKTLIKAGADVNAKNIYGMSALMFTKNPDVAKVLISAGAKYKGINFPCKTELQVFIRNFEVKQRIPSKLAEIKALGNKSEKNVADKPLDKNKEER